MPTENSEVVPGKVFVKTKEDGEPKELKAIDINTVDSEEKYEDIEPSEFTGQCTVTFDVKLTGKMKKMLGIERITRKRFKKLLMGCRIQRNEAEIIANEFCKNKIQYTPLAVQRVVETIMIEAEKREKE